MVLKAVVPAGRENREDMYQLERKYRAMCVVERAIEIALNKSVDPREAAVQAADAFRVGLAEFESGGIRVEEL